MLDVRSKISRAKRTWTLKLSKPRPLLDEDGHAGSANQNNANVLRSRAKPHPNSVPSLRVAVDRGEPMRPLKANPVTALNQVPGNHLVAANHQPRNRRHR